MARSKNNSKQARGFLAMKQQGRMDELKKIASKGGKSSRRTN